MRWGERRLERYSDTRLGSLLLGCFRRYAESSQNSASALVLNVFLSVVPALLAVYALADVSRGSDSGIAQHLIAALVSRPTFPSSDGVSSSAKPDP